jgi:hypothetical protein
MPFPAVVVPSGGKARVTTLAAMERFDTTRLVAGDRAGTQLTAALLSPYRGGLPSATEVRGDEISSAPALKKANGEISSAWGEVPTTVM